MAKSNALPLTAWDLHEIANVTDTVEKAFAGKETSLVMVKSVELARPDCEDRIGRIVPFDPIDRGAGWGFVVDDENA